MTVELVVLEMAAARQRAKRAALSLKRAEEMLDASHGVAVSIALCDRVRNGQARAKAARRRLRMIAPKNSV